MTPASNQLCRIRWISL